MFVVARTVSRLWTRRTILSLLSVEYFLARTWQPRFITGMPIGFLVLHRSRFVDDFFVHQWQSFSAVRPSVWASQHYMIFGEVVNFWGLPRNWTQDKPGAVSAAEFARLFPQPEVPVFGWNNLVSMLEFNYDWPWRLPLRKRWSHCSRELEGWILDYHRLPLRVWIKMNLRLPLIFLMTLACIHWDGAGACVMWQPEFRELHVGEKLEPASRIR